jgi:hypothetical protein
MPETTPTVAVSRGVPEIPIPGDYYELPNGRIGLCIASGPEVWFQGPVGEPATVLPDDVTLTRINLHPQEEEVTACK